MAAIYEVRATHDRRVSSRCSGHNGKLQVTFSALQRFDLGTGELLPAE